MNTNDKKNMCECSQVYYMCVLYKVLILYIILHVYLLQVGVCVHIHICMYLYCLYIFNLLGTKSTHVHAALYFMEYVMLKVFFIIDPCPGPKLALDRALLR